MKNLYPSTFIIIVICVNTAIIIFTINIATNECVLTNIQL